MAIFGININKTNPEFTSSDFTFWMPRYKRFIATEEGQSYFNEIYSIVNNKIFHSIFGSDWKLAMSYAISHYLTLISNQLSAPSGSTLETIAGGGNFKGVLSSATVGNFSKQYDIDKTMLSENEALFWNQTADGASLMSLLKTKAIPSILVVTSGPLRRNC